MLYSHTVVGIFDNDFDSQDAVDELINNGFNRQDIEVNNRRDVNGPSANYTNDSEARHHSHADAGDNAITRFFKTIFGDNSDDADKHSRLAIEGGAVITVHTNSAEEAARAADILDEKGAVDVDDRASKFGYKSGSGTTYYGEAVDSPAMNSNQPYTSPGEAATDTKTDEDLNPRERREESSGPGVGSSPTGGSRSKSRVIEWRGEASARLRDDRDNETKIGW